MRKILIVMLMFVLILSGCNSKKMNDDQQKIYNGFRDSLLNNGELVSSNIPFEYEIVLEKNENKYLYSVEVKNPLVAMKNIQMMMLNPEDLNKDINTSTIGIFDDITIHLIPNQVNEIDGYLKEISLKGVSLSEDFKVLCLVSWKDSNQLTQNQAFFSFDIQNGKVRK